MRALALLLSLVAPAFAADPPAPAAGTVEFAISQSITMIRAGQWDAWMDQWCDPAECTKDVVTRDELKRFQLKRASEGSASCLHGANNAVKVVRYKGNPATDAQVTAYIDCGPNRLPVPSTHKKVGDKWLVVSQSW